MEKLDLNQFLQDPEEHPGQYTLHAVLVHSGKSILHLILKGERAFLSAQLYTFPVKLKSPICQVHIHLDSLLL